MKKLFSALTAAALVLAAVPVSAARISYEKRAVDAYPYGSSEPVVFDCLFRSDLPQVPFLSVSDYLAQSHDTEIGVNDNLDGTYTVTNYIYKMTLDAENDTVSFDCWEGFALHGVVVYDEEAQAPFAQDSGESGFVGEVSGVKLDLGKYGIDVVGFDGKAYLPCCTLNDLFADTYCAAVYSGGVLRFTDTMSMSGYTGGEIAKTRDRALAEFSYSELCFVMDNFYGRPSSAELAQSVGEKGFDRTLAEYSDMTARIGELLRSGSTEEFCTGLRLLDCFFDDGGHTCFSFGQLAAISQFELTEERMTELVSGDAEEVSAMLRKVSEEKELNSALTAQREHAYHAYCSVLKEWEDAALYRTDDTAIFCFDSFTAGVTAEFREALDIAAEKGAKNFVIDVSANIGGLGSVFSYIMDMISGDNTLLEKIELSGNTIKSKSVIDRNLDGVFDEKDSALKYDLRFAVLCSRFSYSAANMLPCGARDRGICVLGEAPGGGCCNAAPRVLPDGTVYQTSGLLKLVHPNGDDYDTKLIPDTVLPGAEVKYAGFYDTDRINAGIAEFCESRETTAPVTAAEPTELETTAAPVTSAPDGANIAIGLTAGAGAIIVLALALFIRSRKFGKKHTSPT